MKKEVLEEVKEYLEELKTIKKEKIIDDEDFITSDKYACTLNNGEVIIREQLKKNKRDGSAVVIVPVLENGDIIVTIEPRVFTRRTVGVSFPAGYIEENEESYISALRELKEEVGCVPKYLIPLANFYQDQGISSAYNTIYLALDCKDGYERNLDPGEFIKYVKCSFSDVLDLVSVGYIEGCDAQLAIERMKPYFKDDKIDREYLESEDVKKKIIKL